MEPLKTVNIYIETDFRGPRRQDGTVMYLLETQTSKGACTRDKIIPIPQTTENHLVLEALEEALGRLNQSCQVEIWLCNRYVASAIESGWVQKWWLNDWETAGGRKVADADLWESIAGYLHKHIITIRLAEYHGYRRWMQDQLKQYSKSRLAGRR